MESVLKTTELMETSKEMARVFRYKGKWYRVNPKPCEPEIQTCNIAWNMIQGTEQLQAYRDWFGRLQKDSKLLYPDFRK